MAILRKKIDQMSQRRATAALKKVFEQSFHRFLAKERNNILNDSNERNLCGRWAMYLQPVAHKAGFKGYYADPDYNRKQNGSVKTILDEHACEVTIITDLILHSRGENIARDNLIAIEMKKSTRTKAEKQEDRLRLRAMTKASFDDIWSNDGTTRPEHVCEYLLGYFIELNIARRTYILQEFRNGKMTDEEHGNL